MAVTGGTVVTQETEPQPILFAATWNTDPTMGIYTHVQAQHDRRIAFTMGCHATEFCIWRHQSNLPPGIDQQASRRQTRDLRPQPRHGCRVRVGADAERQRNSRSSQHTADAGRIPAHVTLSPNEDFVAVANYAGSLSLFPLYKNGTIAPESYHEAFPNGSHVVMDTQATGHIHSTRWLPNSNHIIAANLGGDDLLQYELDVSGQTLKSFESVYRPPGSGPRHTVLSANGDYLYVSNEISNAVGVYKINQNEALLESPAVQNITTIPANFANTSTAADIHLSSNGKFVYVSNRGHNSIAIYTINEADGTLTPLGWKSTRGQTPRGFTIYEDWLIVANQVSDDMYVFKVDGETGLLSYTGNSYVIDGAVCLYVSEYSLLMTRTIATDVE